MHNDASNYVNYLILKMIKHALLSFNQEFRGIEKTSPNNLIFVGESTLKIKFKHYFTFKKEINEVKVVFWKHSGISKGGSMPTPFHLTLVFIAYYSYSSHIFFYSTTSLNNYG